MQHTYITYIPTYIHTYIQKRSDVFLPLLTYTYTQDLFRSSTYASRDVCSLRGLCCVLRSKVSFLVVPLDVTPLPTFDPIRLPPTQANRGLLPPANPLPHELLDFWAEACAATLRCLMSERTADVSLVEGAGRPLRKRGAAWPPGGGLAPRRLPPK